MCYVHGPPLRGGFLNCGFAPTGHLFFAGGGAARFRLCNLSRLNRQPFPAGGSLSAQRLFAGRFYLFPSVRFAPGQCERPLVNLIFRFAR